MTDAPELFDEYARSLTHRLIKASEQDPTRSLEPRRTSVARTAAVLLATVAVVAGLILVGTGVLHVQLSHSPVSSHTPPPVVTAPPTAAPTSTATPSPTVALSGIAELHMFTPTVGWAQRQSDGAILHTTHGVHTWTAASPSIGGQTLLAVAYVDAEAARVLTATVSLEETPATRIQAWSTDNGGATWTKEGSFVDYASQYEPAGTLDFVDRNDGWYSITGLGAAGSSAIFVYRTVDGGAHWSEVDKTLVAPVAGPTKISSGCDKNPVSFINASTGFATAECNGGPSFLEVTHDGGMTWRSQSLGSNGSEYGYSTDPPQFVSGSVGFLVGWVGVPPAPRATVYVTTDGGLSWRGWLTPDYYPEASDFLDADNGWLLLSGPETTASAANLWVTHDAGRTWTNLHASPSVDGLSLDFVSQQLGWAFASTPGGSPPSQQLLQTTDGGRTWTTITPTITGT